MARRELPYPPSPKNVPEDLTLASPKFIYQATLMVLTLFFFLLIYLGLMALCVFGVYWGLSARSFWGLQIIVVFLSILFFAFLFKGFFIRDTHDRTGYVEIDEDDHPELFEFIERLCDEIKVPFPNRVYVTPEVNAAMMYRLSLINLFVRARNDLLLGLGLVNFLNLSEFKAVVAHELGHFAQKGFINSYSYVARSVIASMLLGNDWMDNALNRVRHQENALGVVASALYWTMHGIKQGLYGIFKVINFLDFMISRQREFNADLVAVSVAGSDAIVHGLKRTEFAHEAMMQTFHELEDAADHKLYTDDIFLHHTASAAYIRKQKKDPNFGNLPELNDGKKIQVFDEEEYGQAPMWDYHPSLYDREENAKDVFIPAVMDDRSAWVLFGDKAQELRERASYKFYRIVYKVKKDVELSEAAVVQKFIDDEHAEMTYDPKYGGVYDGRFVDPGSLEELDEMIEKEPWDDERLSRVEAKLYKDLEKRVEDHNDMKKEYNTLMRECNWRPRGKTKRIIKDLDKNLEESYEWFKSFDRRVYLVYMQMAQRLKDPERAKELRNRYKFHLPLQDLNKRAYQHQDKLEFYHNQLFNRNPEHLTQDLVSEAFYEFRQARKGLKQILRDASEMNMPMLKNFTGDEALDEFLLDEPLIKELPEEYVDTKWLGKMWRQLGQVLKKSARLYFKSMGNILAMQEQVAKEFNAMKPPAPVSVVPSEEDIPDAIIEDEPANADQN